MKFHFALLLFSTLGGAAQSSTTLWFNTTAEHFEETLVLGMGSTRWYKDDSLAAVVTRFRKGIFTFPEAQG